MLVDDAPMLIVECIHISLDTPEFMTVKTLAQPKRPVECKNKPRGIYPFLSINKKRAKVYGKNRVQRYSANMKHYLRHIKRLIKQCVNILPDITIYVFIYKQY